MSPRSPLLGPALAAALALAARPAAAVECTPARVGPGSTAASEPWRRAAEELAQATSTPGAPWSCGGGVIEITERNGGATLTVTGNDGRSITREVTAPEEVVPLGEALLSKPLPPAPGIVAVTPTVDRAVDPAAPPPPEKPDNAPPPKAEGAPLAEPRVLVGALVAPRYAGKANLLWGGVTVGITVPIGAWGLGAWGRYDGPAVSFEDHPVSIHELVVGASASRAFTFKRLELRGSVVPSVAVVTRSVPKMDMDGDGDGDSYEETRIDARVGLDARAALSITSFLRAVAAFDVELSPRELAEKRHEHAGPGPEFPSYTLGFGLGLEIAIR
ncbi:MAG: hypothetical protein QM820_05405 [Minicystis sp.]